MIFAILDQIGQSPAMLPVVLFTYVGGIILAFTLHEFAHAVVAYWLGDDTAKRLGRITLNPMAHLEPIGLILILLAGFGWAKPVPFNPSNLRVNPRLGTALIAIAGPAMNLLLAALFALPIRLGVLEPTTGIALSYFDLQSILFNFCWVNLGLNLLLMVFNLLPIAPLDGWKILVGISPRDLGNTLLRYEQYGMAVLFGLFAISYVIPQFNPLGQVMYPVVSSTQRFLIGL